MTTSARRPLSFLIALLSALAFLFAACPLEAATGTLASAKGNVTANGSSVKKGDKVSTEQEIVVPPGGSAVIDFGPGIGKVTLESGTTASIYIDEAGNILVAIKGEGGGANVDTAGVKNYGAVIRDNGASIAALGDRLGIGAGGGISGATGLGLAGLASGSAFGGGGGAGVVNTTAVLPNGSIGLFDQFGRFLGLIP
jgi:hypothetical protein